MKRQLKQLAQTFVPGPLLQRIKAMYVSRTQGEDFPALRLEEMGAFVRCTLEGLEPFDVPQDCKSDLVLFTDTYEGRTEVAGIARLARRGGVLFDIGAHTGLMAAVFCAAHPENRTFCFEPSPMLQSRLEAMRKVGHLEERMQIEPIAIGEKPSTLTMLVDPVGGFVQSQRFEHSMWAEPQEIQVRVESISDCVQRLKVSPDFIKIDIEGYEYEAVKGSLDFLAEKKPVLLFELHLNYLEQRQLSARTLVEMLAGCGYSFYEYSGRPVRAKELYDSPLASVRFYCE